MPSHILGREQITPGRIMRDRGVIEPSPPDPASLIHVEPKNDKMRALIRHPAAGGFREEGGADWPEDAFTLRRIRDGSIVRAEAPQKEPRGEAQDRTRRRVREQAPKPQET